MAPSFSATSDGGVVGVELVVVLVVVEKKVDGSKTCEPDELSCEDLAVVVTVVVVVVDVFGGVVVVTLEVGA